MEGIVNAIHVTSYRGPAGWCVALTLIALACKRSEPVAPTTGGVQVAASTSGADLDADGYTVTLDVGDSTHLTGAVAPIAVNGTVTFSELSPGSHSLLLDGAAGNCPVVGANPRSVFVTAGQTMRITFQVTCLQRADLGGVWNYVERVGQPFACIDTGSYVFTESGAGIAGTNDQIGTCDRQAGSIDNSASGPISGGTVYSAGGVHINLTVGACSYSAEVAGTPPDRMINGAVTCPSGNGSWEAVRGGGAIASVTVSPSTRSIVAGATTQLRAVLIDATGSRRVGPTVTWTSSPSAAATVDASGVVAGVAPGSATITATAETRSGTATVDVEVVSFSTVQAGAFHSCGLAASGAYCWGSGTYGQAGNGAKANGFAPVAVSSDRANLVSLSVGGVHNCGLTASGAAYCWGADYYGELGAGTPGSQVCGVEEAPCSTTPLAVAGGHVFSSLSAGWVQSCALTSAAAYCWGDATYGTLGDGSTASSRTPVAVTNAPPFVSIGTGISFACGLTAGGAAYCWGDNSFGQLGTGPNGPEACSGEWCSKTPVAVSGGLTFTALTVGYWHACGLTSNGAAYCWGNNGDGQLGATTTETCAGFDAVLACSTTPLPVEGTLTFGSVSAGFFHTCGVLTTGEGYCWGSNTNGQLGNGTTTASSTAVPIMGGLSFAGLSAYGRWHSCGLTTAGVAYCWGFNGWGQVGDGTGADALEPVQVAGQAAATPTGPLSASRVRRRTPGVRLRPLGPRASPFALLRAP